MEKSEFMPSNYEVVNFYNIDTEEFRGMYGGEQYVFQPKERKQMVKFMAEHFAKHLAVKILMKKGQEWGDESPMLKDTIGKILGSVKEDTVVTPTPIPAPEPEEPEEPDEFPDVPNDNSDRPFVCEVCGKTFKRQANLSMHKKKHEVK